MPPVPPKMLILEFELEQKMNHHLSIEFHDESNGNSLKAQKLNHDTLIALEFHGEPNENDFKAKNFNHDHLIALIGPNYPKYRLLNFEL